MAYTQATAPIGKRVEVTLDGKVLARGKLRRVAGGALAIADEISGQEKYVPNSFLEREALAVIP